MNRSLTQLITQAVLTLLVSSAGLAASPICQDGSQVAHWKTWVLASPAEVQPPPPPADSSAQTKAELDELRQIRKERDPVTNTAIQYWNAVPATQRWTEEALALYPLEKVNNTRASRVLAILHTAMYDAAVASAAAQAVYQRKPPGQLAPDLSPVATIAAVPAMPAFSYPSEHAAVAAAAAGVLAYLFPKESQDVAAMLQEATQTRLVAGLNYRSDIDAGVELGRAVAQKAIARAGSDGTDAVWTGTVPTGPGLWAGTNPVEPLAGKWKPWLLTSGSQFRPGPPPVFDSPQVKSEEAELERFTAHPTPSQRAIALYWAGNNFSAFYKQAYDQIRHNSMSTPCAARLLGLLSVVTMDAYIAGHEAKYTYWRIRPSQADPAIVPLIPVPGHPSYPADGAAIWTAAAEVMAYFFPQEADRMRYLGEEGTLSRMYAGVHFRSDVEAGATIGRQVAQLAVQWDQSNVGP